MVEHGPLASPLDVQIHDLQRRVDALRRDQQPGADLASALLEELATAQEELRTAAAELHQQHLELLELHDERVRRTEAEARVAALGEFFAIAAHELRTPITSLRGFAHVLTRHFADPTRISQDRVQRAVRRIDEQTHHLDSLIERLLDLSRLDLGQSLRLRRASTDLAELAHRVARALEITSDSHRIVVHCPGEPVVAEVDSLRFEQVLTNLVGNALRHTGAGDVVLIVRRERSGRIYVAVRDHGPGVPPADRERIFQRFYQAELDRQYVAGLGLGLYISRRIVEAHGGRLTVHDAPRGGAIFAIHLPAPLEGESPPTAGAVPAADASHGAQPA
jgi:signal transduction histidine kinase